MKALIGRFAALTLTAGSAAQQLPKIQAHHGGEPRQWTQRRCLPVTAPQCHGLTAGHRPAAKALAKVPADLTRISARNNGTFPGVRVRYIEGSDEIAAHGTRDMPMWGSLFRKMGSSDAAERIESLCAVSREHPAEVAASGVDRRNSYVGVPHHGHETMSMWNCMEWKSDRPGWTADTSTSTCFHAGTTTTSFITPDITRPSTFTASIVPVEMDRVLQRALVVEQPPVARTFTHDNGSAFG